VLDKKILVLSTYPVEEPLHGGQKRIEASLHFYKHYFKEVKFVAVYYKKFFDKAGPDDIAIQDKKIIEAMDKSPFASDLISGEAIYKDPAVKKKMTEILGSFRPDVIQVEQIYPFAGLEPLLEDLGLHPKLILGSQNDETRLKEDIFAGIKMPESERQEFLSRIEELEKNTTRKVDLVIAVNESDAEMHKSLGAKKCIVIPNGISKINPTPAALAHWQQFKAEHDIDKFITFVGSAHPPNFLGFQKMVGQDLDFLPDKSCLMLAGGVSNHIQQEYGQEKPAAKKFWKRAWPLGHLSDDNLAGLIRQSDVIILPIVAGVGSNLKTAEAILADKKVVATRLALRTFEAYENLPNLYLADDQDSFRKAIIKALQTDQIPRSDEQDKLGQKVQWQYCLEPLGRHLEVLTYGRLKTFMRESRRKLGRIKRRFF
jgi:hypothetical protein